MLREMERVVKKEGLSRRTIVIAESDLRNPEKITPLGKREAMSLPASHFDAVVASGALEHAPLTETVRRLARLLKPGGTFFNLGLRRSPVGATLGMMYGVRPYKIADMRRAFERAGLEDIRTAKLSVEEFPANLSRVAIIARKKTF
ncbi:MAG: methyltransferase domain-containing protein [Candidatus Sungbacteria bacterium]|uniref:Methyltransferase domain-containing protein n=1 Tax=Candidatus Sungiibacteriota bacterium TaxID=2750080 RepID=A0A931WPR8_9BACT|nr:methyltransferase domain-containing protein [Candidatus Sungbacteria bacterium]